MATNNIVETVLKLRGSREFQKGAKDAAKSVLGIGDATDKSGRQAKIGWKGVAQWAGGAAALGGATAYLKGAVSETESLAKATMALSRTTGMDTKTASSWAATLKVRGIDTAKFTVGMVALSRQMEAAKAGNEKALQSFNSLGVSMDDIRTGNTAGVLMSMADGFAGITNPAQKAATAQKMLGRQGQALLPLLNSGTKALEEQLQMADDYGATLDGSATDAVKEQIAAQRQWDMAMLGLKVQLGQGVVPALAQMSKSLASVVGWMKPLLSNSTALQMVLVGLVGAYGALKLASLAAMLSQIGFNTSMITTRIATLATTLAVMGFNASMLLIPLAIAAVVIGLVILYKKWGWFHRAVNNTFQWIKDHWRLLVVILTGPLGLAVVMIVNRWKDIKKGAKPVLDWLGGALHTIIGIVKDVAHWIGSLPWDKVGKVIGLAGKVAGGANKVLGHMASGGTVQRTGPYLVGERGPEVVALSRGATVFPTPAVSPVGASKLEPHGGQSIVTKVYLDRRQIAEAVGSYTAGQKARR